MLARLQQQAQGRQIPGVVLAWPGGPGTRHTIAQARQVGVPVWTISSAPPGLTP